MSVCVYEHVHHMCVCLSLFLCLLSGCYPVIIMIVLAAVLGARSNDSSQGNPFGNIQSASCSLQPLTESYSGTLTLSMIVSPFCVSICGCDRARTGRDFLFLHSYPAFVQWRGSLRTLALPFGIRLLSWRGFFCREVFPFPRVVERWVGEVGGSPYRTSFVLFVGCRNRMVSECFR